MTTATREDNRKANLCASDVIIGNFNERKFQASTGTT